MGKNYNIYIATSIQDRLDKEANKSGLINDLLLKHYYGGSKGSAPLTQKALDEAVEKLPEGGITEVLVDKSVPPRQTDNVAEEKACCSNPAPCQHWDWNGNESMWVNKLSGRRKSNDG